MLTWHHKYSTILAMNRPGRPRTSRLDRSSQLREAKRKQRERERAAGLVHVQLTLPRPVADKLLAASRTSGFAESLDPLLDQLVVRTQEFPALRDIAWNRTEEYLPAREAFGLYERNWRFVNPASLDERELALIRRLADRYGAGVIHA
jgi:hypothetical protein